MTTLFEFFCKIDAGSGNAIPSFPLFRVAVSRHQSHEEQQMKTLTTLTAIAALAAGISFAQAQGSMGSSSSPGASGAAPQTIGNAAFCINTSASGGLNCKYASMAACEKDAKPQNLNCSPNPKKSTTGSKQ
jgi:hypothetical protein